MKRRLTFLVLPIVLPIVLVLLVAAARSFTSVEAIESCNPIGNAHPLCGWQNPEDMVALPNGHHVIVSEYGGQNGEKSGTLSLLDLRTETRSVLYRGSPTEGAGPWGARDCTEAPGEEFSPHGIYLSHRADGRMQLLAVQHGGRESIEMFEVTESPEGWALAWRGCALPPVGSMLNDVVATPDGGFLVTHSMTKRDGTLGQFYEYLRSSLFRVESGYVLAWQPNAGFHRLAGSEGRVANGIEISSDGETAFVNYSANGEVRRIDRGSGEIEASATSLPPLDNSTWTPDGCLLVAGALASTLDMMACTNLESGTCPGAYAIFAVDPDTLESEILYQGGPNTPGGAGTVGLLVSDGSLLIGTFAGNCIVRVTP